jgi:hypothetical protein
MRSRSRKEVKIMLASVMGHARRNLVAYVALLFALGGTSYAAATTLLPPNSVGSRQVINHSLLKKDFKSGQLPRGRQGPQGDIGETGDPGPPGIATVGAAAGPAGAMCANGGGTCQVASSTATCPNGSVVVGGGWGASSTDIVVPFAQRTGGTAYGVIGINYSGGSETITAQAICAVGPGVSSAGATQASGASFDKALAHARDQTGR